MPFAAQHNGQVPRPDPTKMYGLLHDMDGQPIEMEVRSLKVGIGVPSGKDIHVWINDKNKWVIEVGEYDSAGKRSSKVTHVDDIDQARVKYGELRKMAPERKYPSKLPYFTFLRLHVDGNFVPDFEAIEKHGSMPDEIDIVFLKDNPLDSAYQWWTAAELKCEGDGRTARRRLELAKGDKEKQLAKEAGERFEKYFPIIEGCFACSCNYAKGDKPVCKPHGRLHMQLVHSPAIGGTCTFDTTGFRSIKQIFSCMRQIRAMTGQGDSESGYIAGVPLKMILRPYKVSHNGKPSVQYGVSLEFRATDAIALVKELKAHADEFRAVTQLPAASQLQITGVVDEEEDYPDEAAEGAAMYAEFYGDFQEPVLEPTSNPFKVKTQTEAPKPEPKPEPQANEQPKAEPKPEPVVQAGPAPEPEPLKRRKQEPKAPPPETKAQPAAALAPATEPTPEPAKPGPVLVKDEPKPAYVASDDDIPFETTKEAPASVAAAPPPPNQAELIDAAVNAVATHGSKTQDAAKAEVKEFMRGFCHPAKIIRPPQPYYEEMVPFLIQMATPQRMAKLLQDPHSAGVTAKAGWEKFKRWADGHAPELLAIEKRVAVECFPEDGGESLIDFVEGVIEAEGKLADADKITFLKVYLKTKNDTAMRLLEMAVSKGVALAELVPNADAATDKELLTLLAGGAA